MEIFWTLVRCLIMPPGLTMELLDCARESSIHMLIKSCMFHYKLELIHPFADGNGRMECLWHTLLLTQWKPLFAWLPMESIIHDHQAEYYAAINRTNYERESTAFALSVIQVALTEAVRTTSAAESMNNDELCWYKIERFLKRTMS